MDLQQVWEHNHIVSLILTRLHIDQFIHAESHSSRTACFSLTDGFIGFSLAYAILFLWCAVAAFQAHRRTSKSRTSLSHMYSPTIFPVFSYSALPGQRNPLSSGDKRVWLVFLTLFLSALWGLAAVLFLQYTWIGLGTHAISIVLMTTYALECTTHSRIRLAKAVRYLGEGTDTYKDVVQRAKLAVSANRHSGCGCDCMRMCIH